MRVVLVPLDEYNSWKETLYLLSNPANAEHLRRSIAEAEAGRDPVRREDDHPSMENDLPSFYATR